MVFKYLGCNTNYEKGLDKDFAKIIENVYRFSDNHISTFCLMLWRGIYPHECMDSRQRYNEASLPDKKEFYSNLTMEDIIGADYEHVKRFWDTKFRRLLYAGRVIHYY